MVIVAYFRMNQIKQRFCTLETENRYKMIPGTSLYAKTLNSFSLMGSFYKRCLDSILTFSCRSTAQGRCQVSMGLGGGLTPPPQ